MAILGLLLAILPIFSLPTLVTSQERDGVIGLWSDSECNSKGNTLHFSEPDPIALNFTLDPDTCGVPFNTVHSYKVRSFAVCENGTEARFSYYDSDDCTPPPTDEDGTGLLRRQMGMTGDTGFDIKGQCLALVAFNSFAFECDGVFTQTKRVPLPGSDDSDSSTESDGDAAPTSNEDSASPTSYSASSSSISATIPALSSTTAQPPYFTGASNSSVANAPSSSSGGAGAEGSSSPVTYTPSEGAGLSLHSGLSIGSWALLSLGMIAWL